MTKKTSDQSPVIIRSRSHGLQVSKLE